MRWKCSSCHRSVPDTEQVCRCGLPRAASGFGSGGAGIDARAGAGASAPYMSRDLLNSWQVVGLMFALLLALAYGVYVIVRPPKPQKIVPLLGYADVPIPRPSVPSPKPRPMPPTPPPPPARK